MISEKDLLIYYLSKKGYTNIQIAEIFKTDRTIIRKILTELERKILKEKREYNIEQNTEQNN